MRHSQNLNDERNKRRDRLNSVPEGISSNQFLTKVSKVSKVRRTMWI